MTTSGAPRDGETPPHAPPGGLIGALLLIYGTPAIIIVAAILALTR